MTIYLIRRLLLMLPTLLGITAVVFFIMAAAPGDVAELLLSREGEMKAGDRQARVEYIRQRYGLDDPLLVQYGRWLHKISPVGVQPDDAGGNPGGFGFKTPDLGHSFVKNRSVLTLVGEALPVTLLLNVITIPVVYGLAIMMGVYAARHRGRSFDVTSGVAMMALWSIPAIWAGVVVQGFLANDQYVRWFPTVGLHSLRADSMPFLPHFAGGFQPGWILDMLWHLALPILCLSYGSLAVLSKLSRGAVLENIVSDYVRTARAKGVSERDVLWRHAFRNSLLPLITVAAHIIPGLLAGSIIVETIFGIPGMGRLMIEAIKLKDQEVVMASTLVGGVLTLVSYLIADVLYALADPRVSYE